MPRLKSTPCRNCGERPSVRDVGDFEMSEGYSYVLSHTKNWCYPTFKLITFQNTKLECIKEWNEFNT